MLLVALIVLIFTFIYCFVRKKQSYWTDRGIKQKKQKFLLGGFYELLFRKQSVFDIFRELYQDFPDERYVGTYEFLTPVFHIRDPDLIKQMLVKDFDHFVDHQDFLVEGVEPMWSNNLFFLRGNKWRDMRTTLSPSFTSSKMRLIFNLISECAEEFLKYFQKQQEPVITVELKDTFSRFANDVIASLVFGVKCNSLEEPENQFYMMGKEATQILNGFGSMIKLISLQVCPNLCKVLGMTLFSNRMRSFFTKTVSENIEMREKQGLIRQDMLHLLIEAKKGRNKNEENQDILDAGFATAEESNIHLTRKIVKEKITDLDITAQCLVFFFAGFEGVSTSMSFLGYELATNPEIQQKLQEEIDFTLKTGGENLTYEALVKMKYMDMVVSEAIRKWSSSFGIDRVCVKSYTIEPKRPNEKPVHFKIGDKLWVPTIAIHWDAKYFPKPEVFDPERFSEENRENIEPYTYLPFGVGPRNCIGSRFALLEIKTLLFHLLSQFDLVVVEKTQIPLQLSKTSLVMNAEKGFWVGLKRRFRDV